MSRHLNDFSVNSALVFESMLLYVSNVVKNIQYIGNMKALHLKILLSHCLITFFLFINYNFVRTYANFNTFKSLGSK